MRLAFTLAFLLTSSSAMKPPGIVRAEIRNGEGHEATGFDASKTTASHSDQAPIHIDGSGGSASTLDWGVCPEAELFADGTPKVEDGAYFFKDHAAESGSLTDKADGWFDTIFSKTAFPIDFVYCWAGEAVQHDGEGMQQTNIKHFEHNSGEGFGEIRWSLKYLEANAPWFNKVYILVNTPADRPKWLSEQSNGKVEIIDRCTLLGSQNCPTKNSAACESVMHKIPNLSEHFVGMQDDMVIINPTQPSDFFSDDGKPLVLAKGAEEQHDMYDNIAPGPNQPPANRPTRMVAFRHIPTPMLVSFAEKQEQTYPEWYSFVRSHHTRFVCCDANQFGNGLDEEFLRVTPHMLIKESIGLMGAASHHHNCMQNPCDHGRDHDGDCYISHLNDKSNKFLVLQTIESIDTWKKVEAAMAQHLPAQSQLVVG